VTKERREKTVPQTRLTRLGHLGAMAGGVAGNMAANGLVQLGQGKRPTFRDLMLTPTNVTRVTNQLAKMRGAAMKIGQLVSMDTGDFVPPELAKIMARLREDGDSMPPSQLKKQLNGQWPQGWLASFASFDVRPVAAASIGQVHRALLKDGRDLAIKIQFPGVKQSIDSDVSNVGALIRMSGLLPKGFDLAPYLKEAAAQLHSETDYDAEAAALAQFGTLLAPRSGFIVPRVHPDWSTPQILAMDFVSGIPIEDTVSQPQAERNRIGTALITLTLDEMFRFGVMQTDPNFANYRYQPETGKIVLLDFGATRNIDPLIIEQYRRLLRAGWTDDAETQLAAARDIGFFDQNTAPAHRDQLQAMLKLIFATLREDRSIDFANQPVAKQLQTAGLDLINDGFVPPPLPIDALLLQRKLAGVFLICARLGAMVDVDALITPHLS